jgi:hypothetical protein
MPLRGAAIGVIGAMSPSRGPAPTPGPLGPSFTQLLDRAGDNGVRADGPAAPPPVVTPNGAAPAIAKPAGECQIAAAATAGDNETAPARLAGGNQTALAATPGGLAPSANPAAPRGSGGGLAAGPAQMETGVSINYGKPALPSGDKTAAISPSAAGVRMPAVTWPDLGGQAPEEASPSWDHPPSAGGRPPAAPAGQSSKLRSAQERGEGSGAAAVTRVDPGLAPVGAPAVDRGSAGGATGGATGGPSDVPAGRGGQTVIGAPVGGTLAADLRLRGLPRLGRAGSAAAAPDRPGIKTTSHNAPVLPLDLGIAAVAVALADPAAASGVVNATAPGPVASAAPGLVASAAPISTALSADLPIGADGAVGPPSPAGPIEPVSIAPSGSRPTAGDGFAGPTVVNGAASAPVAGGAAADHATGAVGRIGFVGAIALGLTATPSASASPPGSAIGPGGLADTGDAGSASDRGPSAISAPAAANPSVKPGGGAATAAVRSPAITDATPTAASRAALPEPGRHALGLAAGADTDEIGDRPAPAAADGNPNLAAAPHAAAATASPAAPPGPAPAVSPADRAALGPSLAELPQAATRHLVGAVENGPQEILLQLHPPELGELSIRVAVDGRDVMAWFASPHAAVQQVLSQTVGQLHAELGSAGYSLVGAWVGADASGAGEHSLSPLPQRERRKPETGIAEPTSATPQPPSSSGISVYV